MLGDEIVWDGLRDSCRVERAPLRPIYDVYPAELDESDEFGTEDESDESGTEGESGEPGES